MTRASRSADSNSSKRTPLTEPSVPTGMKTGVSTAPRRVSIIPARASPSRASVRHKSASDITLRPRTSNVERVHAWILLSVSVRKQVCGASLRPLRNPLRSLRVSKSLLTAKIAKDFAKAAKVLVLARERRQANLLAQVEDELLPLLLEGVHVRLGEDFPQGVEACGVCRAVGEELAVEAYEQAALLQVVAEVARLRVVRALVFVVESSVVHREERLEGRQAAAAYGLLQAGQTPVCEAAYVPVTHAALLVERTHAFVEPRGHAGEVGLHEGVHNLVDERAAAGLDVHDERLVCGGVVAVGRRGFVAEEAARVCAVRGRVLEEPDVENLRRVFREVVALQKVNGPLHSPARVLLDRATPAVADDDERRLDHDRELARR